MDRTLRATDHALGRVETRYAPDERVAVYDVTSERREQRIVLRGVASTEYIVNRAIQAVQQAVDAPVDDEVTVLEPDAEERVVAASRVSCRGEPTDNGERVTELRYGQSVHAYDARGDWRRVRCPDGYVAWVRESALTVPGTTVPNAIVTATRIEVPGLVGEQNGVERPIEVFYAGTPCERTGTADGDQIDVAFRTGASATLPADAVGEQPSNPSGADIVAVAESFLGTDYRWGGMTIDGIDCSGLVWVSYSNNGVVLPRDADQQRAMGHSVERDALVAGDLLFFPGHVAISTGGTGVVHAERASGGVVRASLDSDVDAVGPHHTGYNERLDDEFVFARRLL